jgi:two-component system chemotaxis response regulator CheY
MLIQIVKKHAEKVLLTELEGQHNKPNHSVLLCRFSLYGIVPPDAESLMVIMKGLFVELDAKLLYCHDGDLFIKWNGATKHTVETLEKLILDYCAKHGHNNLPEDFFQYYDLNAHNEELKVECAKKIQNIPSQVKTTKNESEQKMAIAEFSENQKVLLQHAILHRDKSVETTVLIIEDQTFSRMLMLNVLGKRYPCYTAKDGKEAIDKYSVVAPNIVFLDIELPDINGHDLAKLFKNADPNAHIIMVTANNYTKDVLLAKENGAEGFIIKPYNKQKILESIDNYINFAKKRS